MYPFYVWSVDGICEMALPAEGRPTSTEVLRMTTTSPSLSVTAGIEYHHRFSEVAWIWISRNHSPVVVWTSMASVQDGEGFDKRSWLPQDVGDEWAATSVGTDITTKTSVSVGQLLWSQPAMLPYRPVLFHVCQEVGIMRCCSSISRLSKDFGWFERHQSGICFLFLILKMGSQ